MDRKLTMYVVVFAFVALIVLFEVTVNVKFSLPGDKRVIDAEQEALYAACYTGRDRQIHAVAFGTIDNPDVQKLYISNNRAEAAAECRRQFLQQWTTIAEPMRFNLIDLRFRFQ